MTTKYIMSLLLSEQIEIPNMVLRSVERVKEGGKLEFDWHLFSSQNFHPSASRDSLYQQVRTILLDKVSQAYPKSLEELDWIYEPDKPARSNEPPCGLRLIRATGGWIWEDGPQMPEDSLKRLLQTPENVQTQQKPQVPVMAGVPMTPKNMPLLARALAESFERTQRQDWYYP